MAPKKKKKTKAELALEAEAAAKAAEAEAAAAAAAAEAEARRIAEEEARLAAEAQAKEEARLRAIEDAKEEKRRQAIIRAEYREMQRIEAERREAVRREMERPRPSAFAFPPWREQLHTNWPRHASLAKPQALRAMETRRLKYHKRAVQLEFETLRKREAYDLLRDHQRISAARSRSVQLKKIELSHTEAARQLVWRGREADRQFHAQGRAKMYDTRSYPFSFLPGGVYSCLPPPPRAAVATGAMLNGLPPRANSATEFASRRPKNVARPITADLGMSCN
ncbi:MAG: hypothetical protein SGPRY_002670 [Prymnesium sp.]